MAWHEITGGTGAETDAKARALWIPLRDLSSFQSELSGSLILHVLYFEPVIQAQNKKSVCTARSKSVRFTVSNYMPDKATV